MPHAFFEDYFDYIGTTEAPIAYHRWAITTMVAAAIGRKSYVPLGHFKVFPNMYTILVGVSGTRKSTAIGQAKDVLSAAGYPCFSADKTTKEKFVTDLMNRNSEVADPYDLDDITVMDSVEQDAEICIANDELLEFLGQGNTDFITMLSTMWDMRDSYESRVKLGKSTKVSNPTVSLIGGATTQTFALTFPPEIIGMGFLSRLILIHADPTGVSVAWPEELNPEKKLVMARRLRKIREAKPFKTTITPEAKNLISEIYASKVTIDDGRFTTYATRRHTHFLKLCLVLAQMRGSTIIDVEIAKLANGMLYYSERRMPLALGEFGKGKFADVSNSVMEALSNSPRPLSITDLWKLVAQDLSRMSELTDVLSSLKQMDKLSQLDVQGRGACFIAKRTVTDYFDSSLIDTSLLTQEEIDGV